MWRRKIGLLIALPVLGYVAECAEATAPQGQYGQQGSHSSSMSGSQDGLLSNVPLTQAEGEIFSSYEKRFETEFLAMDQTVRTQLSTKAQELRNLVSASWSQDPRIKIQQKEAIYKRALMVLVFGYNNIKDVLDSDTDVMEIYQKAADGQSDIARYTYISEYQVHLGQLLPLPSPSSLSVERYSAQEDEISWEPTKLSKYREFTFRHFDRKFHAKWAGLDFEVKERLHWLSSELVRLSKSVESAPWSSHPTMRSLQESTVFHRFLMILVFGYGKIEREIFSKNFEVELYVKAKEGQTEIDDYCYIPGSSLTWDVDESGFEIAENMAKFYEDLMVTKERNTKALCKLETPEALKVLKWREVLYINNLNLSAFKVLEWAKLLYDNELRLNGIVLSKKKKIRDLQKAAVFHNKVEMLLKEFDLIKPYLTTKMSAMKLMDVLFPTEAQNKVTAPVLRKIESIATALSQEMYNATRLVNRDPKKVAAKKKEIYDIVLARLMQRSDEVESISMDLEISPADIYDKVFPSNAQRWSNLLNGVSSVNPDPSDVASLDDQFPIKLQRVVYQIVDDVMDMYPTDYGATQEEKALNRDHLYQTFVPDFLLNYDQLKSKLASDVDPWELYEIVMAVTLF